MSKITKITNNRATQTPKVKLKRENLPQIHTFSCWDYLIPEHPGSLGGRSQVAIFLRLCAGRPFTDNLIPCKVVATANEEVD